MSTEDVELTRRAYEWAAQHGGEPDWDLLADDVQIVNLPDAPWQPSPGKEGMQEWLDFANDVASDFRMEVDEVEDLGEGLVLVLHPPAGVGGGGAVRVALPAIGPGYLGSVARKVWVLDTDTKGTGAEMVPLDRVQQRRRAAQKGARAAERRRFREALGRSLPKPDSEEPEPRQPRRFKVVDVLSREALAEDVGVRDALELLRGQRSVVDVIVYVWDRRTQDWRPLTMREQKVLWEERQAAARSESGSDSPVS